MGVVAQAVRGKNGPRCVSGFYTQRLTVALDGTAWTLAHWLECTRSPDNGLYACLCLFRRLDPLE